MLNRLHHNKMQRKSQKILDFMSIWDEIEVVLWEFGQLRLTGQRDKSLNCAFIQDI